MYTESFKTRTAYDSLGVVQVISRSYISKREVDIHIIEKWFLKYADAVFFLFFSLQNLQKNDGQLDWHNHLALEIEIKKLRLFLFFPFCIAQRLRRRSEMEGGWDDDTAAGAATITSKFIIGSRATHVATLIITPNIGGKKNERKPKRTRRKEKENLEGEREGQYILLSRI